MPKIELDDIESDIFDLCRAVKVISAVIAHQLEHPDTPLELSENGLETQSFRVDASMVRYAVDHAADLGLALRHRLLADQERGGA